MRPVDFLEWKVENNGLRSAYYATGSRLGCLAPSLSAPSSLRLCDFAREIVC